MTTRFSFNLVEGAREPEGEGEGVREGKREHSVKVLPHWYGSLNDEPLEPHMTHTWRLRAWVR